MAAFDLLVLVTFFGQVSSGTRSTEAKCIFLYYSRASHSDEWAFPLPMTSSSRQARMLSGGLFWSESQMKNIDTNNLKSMKLL